jgi:hypothetical protein
MMLQDYNCVLCTGSVDESSLHLFLECPFAAQCWGWLGLHIDSEIDPFEILHSLRSQLGLPFSMEIIITMCWTIWKARNDWIFRQIPPSLQMAKTVSGMRWAASL